MNNGSLFSFSNRWFRLSLGLTLMVASIGAVLGLVVFPDLQHEIKSKGLWNAICGAAGVTRNAPASEIVTSNAPASKVMLTSTMFDHPDPAAIERGAVLARSCAECHGGVDNTTAKFPSPNLSGQPASAIYKQLMDYQSGARSSTVMLKYVSMLSGQNIADLSVYYAHEPHISEPQIASVAEPSIVEVGAPIRSIPACGSCHEGNSLKVGTPWLDGQPVVYLRAELNAYANGSRRNDTSAQMRVIAQQMSQDEMEQASRYFASLR